MHGLTQLVLVPLLCRCSSCNRCNTRIFWGPKTWHTLNSSQHSPNTSRDASSAQSALTQHGEAPLCQDDFSKKLKDLATVDLSYTFLVSTMEQYDKYANYFWSLMASERLAVKRRILYDTSGNEYDLLSADITRRVNQLKGGETFALISSLIKPSTKAQLALTLWG